MQRNIFYHLKIGFIWAAYMPFVLVTWLIVWLDRKMKFPLPFPRDIAALAEAQAWCINQLQQNGVLSHDAIVTEYNVTPLNQDLIFRSNAGIIEINYKLEGKNAQLKCFAKFAPTVGTVWNRAIFNLQLNHIKETWFNQYFIQAGADIPAPKAYYTRMSTLTGNLCLITELMNDCKEYHEGKDDSFPPAHLDMVLEGMAALHAGCRKETSERMKKVMPIEDSTIFLFDSMVASSWSVTARNILVKSWSKMNEKETVLHGDARVGNMMFPKSDQEGRFVFIDWQAVRQGKGVYDLAYFLILSLSTEYRNRVEQQSLDRYLELLASRGVSDYSKEELQEDYNHACLCVLVLLSLPMLSGEASVEGHGAKVFAWGMNIWRERMEAKFNEFDYSWMAARYNITEPEGRGATKEMLSIIERRVASIQDAERGVNNSQSKVQS